MREKLAKVITS